MSKRVRLVALFAMYSACRASRWEVETAKAVPVVSCKSASITERIATVVIAKMRATPSSEPLRRGLVADRFMDCSSRG